MNQQIEKNLIKKIKEKKELADVADEVVLDILNSILKKYSLSLANLREKEIKLLIKEVRANLRYYTGQFQKKSKQRQELSEQNNIHELLKTHSSTQERLSDYPFIEKLLSELNVHSILDLGCGLNPLAIAKKEYIYYAADIKEDELKIVESFFRKNNISGKTFVCDLRKIRGCSLPSADVCLLFKVLDIIDLKGHANAAAVLDSVHCKHIIASFPSRKLSGKKMNRPHRAWFEKMLSSKGLSYKRFDTSNEIFYVITRI